MDRPENDLVRWREFVDFREEARSNYRSLEQKIWGLVGAVFLVVVGYLLSQIFPDQGAHATSAATAVANYCIDACKALG